MLNILNLIDDAKCRELVRNLRWPNKVQCIAPIVSTSGSRNAVTLSKTNALPIDGRPRLCYTLPCLGMTGFDGEGWSWTASRARFTPRKTGSNQ